MTNIRKWIEDADKTNLLRRIKKETDVRSVSGILNENRTQPMLFENLVGYDMSLIGQIISSPDLVAFALGVEPTDEAIQREYTDRTR